MPKRELISRGYNLLLRGISRVRLLDEVPTDKLYRSAKVEVVPDRCTAPLPIVMDLRKQLEDYGAELLIIIGGLLGGAVGIAAGTSKKEASE